MTALRQSLTDCSFVLYKIQVVVLVQHLAEQAEAA